MSDVNTKDLHPEIWRLFDRYVHGLIDRRGFLDGPDVLGGRFAPAQVALVHHVIMQQRGGVDELHRSRQRMGRRVGLADGIGRDQRDQRPQAFAASSDDVT
jgi:hypothetical protein